MFPFAHNRGAPPAAVVATVWSVANSAVDWAITNSGLTATHSGTNFTEARASIYKSSSASFNAVRTTPNASGVPYVGVNASGQPNADISKALIVDMSSGASYLNGLVATSAGAIAQNDIVNFELLANGVSLVVSVNGAVRQTYTLSAGLYTPCTLNDGSASVTANFAPPGKPAWG